MSRLTPILLAAALLITGSIATGKPAVRLVGIIASEDGASIAVLRDIGQARSYFLRTGETLPTTPSFRVLEIKPNMVIVSVGKNRQTLNYEGSQGLPVESSIADIALAELPRFEETPELALGSMTGWQVLPAEDVEWSPVDMEIPDEISPSR